MDADRARLKYLPVCGGVALLESMVAVKVHAFIAGSWRIVRMHCVITLNGCCLSIQVLSDCMS